MYITIWARFPVFHLMGEFYLHGMHTIFLLKGHNSTLLPNKPSLFRVGKFIHLCSSPDFYKIFVSFEFQKITLKWQSQEITIELKWLIYNELIIVIPTICLIIWQKRSMQQFWKIITLMFSYLQNFIFEYCKYLSF